MITTPICVYCCCYCYCCCSSYSTQEKKSNLGEALFCIRKLIKALLAVHQRRIYYLIFRHYWRFGSETALISDMDNDEHQSPKNKKGWYPGKYVKAMRRSSATSGKGSSHHGDETTVASQASLDIADPYVEGESPSNSFSGSNPMNEGDQGDVGVNEGKEPRKVTIVKTRKLGKVILTIHEVRYLAVQSPKLLVELDGILPTNIIYSDSVIPYTKEYDFTDISSDLKIEFRGVHMTTAKAVSAYVLLPLSQCLSVTGKPVKLAKKWYELYPFYDRTKLGEPPKVTKFRNAYPEIPGSGLQKFNFPLGFVSLEMEIQLADDIKNGFSLYFYPSLPMNNTRYDEEADVNESNLVLTSARMNRDIERVKNVLFRPIACIAPFLSFPEVFPLILVSFSSFLTNYSSNILLFAFLFDVIILISCFSSSVTEYPINKCLLRFAFSPFSTVYDIDYHSSYIV